MKLAPDLRIVNGISTSAAYLLSRSTAHRLSAVEKTILTAIPQTTSISSLSRSTNLSHLVVRASLRRLRRLKIILPGKGGAPLKKLTPLYQPPIPKKIYRAWLEVTSACNLNCPHCYMESSSPTNNQSGEMDWHHAINQILDYGCEHITFIGGEPLLKIKLVKELLERVSQHHTAVTAGIFSNLTHKLDDELLSYSDLLGVTYGTSLHGANEAAHDSFTGKIGSYQATLSNIKKLQELNISLFVGITLLEKSQSECDEIKTRMAQLGIENFTMNAPSQIGRGKEYQGALEEHCTQQTFHSKAFSNHTLEIGTSYHNCYYDHIAINEHGFIYPCIMTRDPIMNIMDKPLHDYFTSPKYEFYRDLSKKVIDGCKHCEFRYACNDCRASAWSAGQNWFEKPNCGFNPTSAPPTT